jgi:hypothetical protein
MLCFAVDYCKAIESISLDRKNDLRQFKLVEDEWAIMEELRDTLKVCDVMLM